MNLTAAGRWRGFETAVRLLWLAALLDFLLGRLFSRVGVYMPKSPLVTRVYNLLADAGQVAFNAGLLLGLALLGLLLWQALAGRLFTGGGPGAAALTLTALLFVVLSPGKGPASLWSLLTIAAMLAAVGVLAAGTLAGQSHGGWFRAGLGLVLLAHLAAYGAPLAQIIAALAGRPGAVAHITSVLRLGELAAMLAPLCLFASLWGRRRPRAWLRVAPAGLLVVALFSGVYLANADMAGVLAVWSLGFTLTWPALVYMAALGTGVCYLAATAAGPALERVHAYGLGLIFLAGFTLQLSQQHLLVLLGYVLLHQAPALAAAWLDPHRASAREAVPASAPASAALPLAGRPDAVTAGRRPGA